MKTLRNPAPFLLLATLTFLLALPASADWLVTLEGQLIETEGPWSIAGDTLTYTRADGEKHEIALADVDLEASEETTALKAGKPYVPKPKPEPAAEPAVAAESGEPKVTLYMTSWCGYCRRTSRLLKSLDVAFVEKDIEKDPAARKEYRQKAGNYRGIPVLDVDGRIVRGFQATLIHKLVTELQQKEAAAQSGS